MIAELLSVVVGCDPGAQSSSTTDTATSTGGTSEADGDMEPGHSGHSGHSTSNDGAAGGEDAGPTSGGADPGSADRGSEGGAGESGSSGDEDDPPIEQEGHLLWHVDAETGAAQAPEEPRDGLTPYLCVMHAEEAMSFDLVAGAYGDYAIRTKVREDWPWGNNNTCHHKVRAYFLNRELVHLAEGEPVWMGWAIYVPEDWAPGDSSIGAVNYHGPPGTPPQFTVSLNGHQWRTSSRFGLSAQTWPMEPGTWNEFVVHAAFDNDDDGFVQLWHKLRDDTEWTQYVDYQGTTVENGSEFPFHTRVGLIGPKDWQDSADERELFFDEVRLGDEMSSFDEVVPGSGYQLPGFDQ
ncbi:MAG: heparin lyase I family protein [Myxococcota bacterium]